MKKGALIFILCGPTIFGQNQPADSEDADHLFENGRFSAAYAIYKDALKTDPFNARYHYKIGSCLIQSRSQKEKALEFFNKAIVLADESTVEELVTFKQLAEACYAALDYDQAIICYRKYEKFLLANTPENELALNEVALRIELCQLSKELKSLKEPSRSSLKHPKSPVPTPDPSVKVKAVPAPHIQINSSDTGNILKEATVATSADKQMMLTYRNDNGKANLYSSALKNNQWSEAVKLHNNIHNRSWEPDETLSPDGNTLYFAADLEGGYGGFDIYKCDRLPNGEWGTNINLGPKINTAKNEIAPLILSDNTTFYFSSDRFKANGAFDIFYCLLNDTGKKGIPQSVGYPRKLQDTTAAKIPIKETAANRESLYGQKKNLTVKFMCERGVPLTIIKGCITDRDGKVPPYVEIIVTDNKSGFVSGVYRPNKHTGDYQFILPPGNNSNVRYEAEGYLFHSENIDISKDTGDYKLLPITVLRPISKGSMDVLNNIFFENNSAELLPTSLVELNTVFAFLNKNPQLSAEIVGMRTQKTKKTAVELAMARANSIVDHLRSKGIYAERLNTKIIKVKKTSGKNEPDKLWIRISSVKNK